MFLHQEDTNLKLEDTKYGRTPLSLVAESGNEEIVNMLGQRNNILTSTPDNQNQTPLSLALSKGHHGVVKILQEREHANSDVIHCNGRSSLTMSGVCT